MSWTAVFPTGNILFTEWFLFKCQSGKKIDEIGHFESRRLSHYNTWNINTSVLKENSSTSLKDFILLLTLKEICSFFGNINSQPNAQKNKVTAVSNRAWKLDKKASGSSFWFTEFPICSTGPSISFYFHN